MVRILILYHSVHTKSPNYGMFGSLFIPKNKKLFLGIKSGAKGSEVELFWGGFSRISSKLIYYFSIGLGFKTLFYHFYLSHCFHLIKRL